MGQYHQNVNIFLAYSHCYREKYDWVAILFQWADDRRMVDLCTRDSPNNIPQVWKSEFFIFLDWLRYVYCGKKFT